MSPRIMVVEDDTLIRQLLYYQLSGAGYDVKCITNGRQALERLLLDLPDLVILDVMMPELSGWDTCRQIRASSDVPIIMLTAKSADDDMVTGLTLGADDYVTKPFSMPLLLARVEAVLRRRVPSRQTTAPISHRRANQEIAPGKLAIDTDANSLTERYASSLPLAAAPAVAQSAPLPSKSVPSVAQNAPGQARNPESKGQIGRLLYKQRNARGESLQRAAEACGVRWELLGAIEREDWAAIPRAERRWALQRYCTYLGVNMKEALSPPPRSVMQMLMPGQIPLPFLLLIVFAIAIIIIGIAML